MVWYFLGIDAGSQSTKVTVFDEHGAVHAEGREPLRPADVRPGGVVEHPDDDLWVALGAATRKAMRAFTGEKSHIVAAGLCSIRFCRAMLRSDGTLAAPVLSWMDDRVGRAYQQQHDDVAYLTTSSGYLTHRLTGQFRDTVANYQGVWPVDTDRWAYSDDPADYRRTGMASSMLFELCQPGEVLGSVHAAAAAHTGLPQGLPVVATANDKAVEALGAGLRGPDAVLLSLGTYIAAMTTGARNVAASPAVWTNFGCIPGRYLYESTGIRRGMWTVSWLRELLGEPDLRALDAGAARLAPGSDGLLAVLDWLAPAEAAHRRGALLGFDARHGAAHLYRAVLEGIALTMAGHIEAMAAELGHDYREVIVSGGGAGSAVMLRIVADVLGIPAVRTTIGDAAGLGAAICAAAASGHATDLDAAATRMVHRDRTLPPQPRDHERYREIQLLHREARETLDRLFARNAAVFDGAAR